MKSSLGNREVFAENLKRFMDKENVSRRDLSKALNIPYTTLTTWLKGESYPRIDNHHLMLVACNSAYPPEQVDAQDIYLIGRCVGVYKNL